MNPETPPLSCEKGFCHRCGEEGTQVRVSLRHGAFALLCYPCLVHAARKWERKQEALP